MPDDIKKLAQSAIKDTRRDARRPKPIVRTKDGRWAKGSSGNAGGRARVVQEFVGQRLVKISAEMAKIAFKDVREVRDDAGNLIDVKVPNDAVKLNALKALLDYGGFRPPEQTEAKVQVEGGSTRELATADLVRAALLEALGGVGRKG